MAISNKKKDSFLEHPSTICLSAQGNFFVKLQKKFPYIYTDIHVYMGI